MVVSVVVALVAALVTAFLLVLTGPWHSSFSTDAPGSGPQKLHDRPTPRVGGIAIMVGFVVATVLARVQSQADTGANAPPWLTAWLIVALFVPFAAGLVEDVTKSCGARLRLLASFAGAAIAYVFCGAALTSFAVPPLDALLAVHPAVSFVFTLFCVGAIANAYNLADGLNGLLAGLAIAACAALATVANVYGDAFMAIAPAALGAATLGFAVFNFPRARLFAGDGGAYMIGTAISLFAILLCRRHPEVSPWFAFALVLYPFVDTTVAIVRRLASRRPIMEPDADHLHTLLALRLSERFGSSGRNMASLAIVISTALFILAAVMLHKNTGALIALCAVFALMYICVYRQVMTARGSADLSGAAAQAESA